MRLNRFRLAGEGTIMAQTFASDFKLGVLGGGQLGRMLIQAAINLNLAVYVMDPDPNAPCRDIATHFQLGRLQDFEAVYTFGKGCDLITIEIEDVNTAALKTLQAEGKIVLPQPDVIELIQDKRVQKQFYQTHGIPTADFVLTENREDLAKHQNFLPAIHKLGKGGYDGRGVQKILGLSEIEKGFDAPGVLETFIDIEKELSVIVARNAAGENKVFPAVELVFHPEHNLVDYLFTPAAITAQMQHDAQHLAGQLIDRLDMVGLLAVEMFVTREGQLLVNEVAPRPHNSGHQTIEDNFTSQFEQHLRAILNLPLGATDNKIPSAMINLLGEDGFTGPPIYDGMEEVLAVTGASVHLYGKALTKPFRKMGHVTIIDRDVERLKQKVQFVKHTLRIIA